MKYQKTHRREQAYIELFIDNILKPIRKISDVPLSGLMGCILRMFTNTKFFLDWTFSSTLYHEIGHHIHKTQSPEHAEREDVADRWGLTLQRRYLYWKYWYYMPLIWGIRMMDKRLRNIPNKYRR